MYIVTGSDLERAGQTLVNGFMDYEQYVAIARDPELRELLLRAVFSDLLKPGQKDQRVTASSLAMEGVAVWWSPEKDWKQPRDLPDTVPGIAEVNAFTSFTLGYFKHHLQEPAWYLAAVAVMPDRQRRGIGLQLIREQLDAIDQDNPAPCFLETQRSGNRNLYERLGFRVVDSSHVPGGKTCYYAMVRAARYHVGSA